VTKGRFDSRLTLITLEGNTTFKNSIGASCGQTRKNTRLSQDNENISS